jgi:hypothetical protein
MRISMFLLRWLLIPIVALWGLHMFQRRHAAVVGRKRYATLFLTAVLIVIWIVAWMFVRAAVRDIFLIPVGALAIAVVAWQHRVFFPFRLTCDSCGTRLSVRRVLFFESNTCEACEKREKPGP